MIDWSATGELKNHNRRVASLNIYRVRCRRRLQQRAWLLALAGIDRISADWIASFGDDVFQTTRLRRHLRIAACALMVSECQRWNVLIVSFGIIRTYAVWK